MKIITAAIIKGGTGKTSTCAALAQAAAAEGLRVLAVDLDAQANFSFSLGADQNQPGTYQLLHGTPAAQLIQRTAQDIAVIPASPDLATETTKPGSAKRLAAALEPIREDFDLCFIDTPPQIGELTFNALWACTDLIIPLETDNNSLQGLYQITDIAKQIQKSNPALRIAGTIVTRYDGRPKINRYLLEAIENNGREIGAQLLGTVRNGVAIREAQAMQLSLFKYAPGSKPAQDYKIIYDKLMEG